ncbi:MAG TPA: hypothetical protein DEP53_14300 [Bacteroidetes bacterium]|nr:hypothetical protein [Bacteroidota bacterium]
MVQEYKNEVTLRENGLSIWAFSIMRLTAVEGFVLLSQMVFAFFTLVLAGCRQDLSILFISQEAP